ncbi:copper resistance protein NlpE [Pinibacter aurantiacus]|uniref:Copper resistance protein NlpE n=1 Tax=Pinibacter aurantiacus TaxID=2851599 RepID=A0A9E2W6A3_9BACT|nr:copper resistance protein NlpE [Pinibacter aurantiacus]MBV4359854.1 copper resistance protein NlpE [Pinibacter aurantiacus]
MKKLLFAFSILAFAACNSNTVSEKTTAEVKDSIAKDNVTAKDGSAEETTKAATTDTIHNAANSLDIAGTYSGKLPCADCEGIEESLELKADKTFVMTDEYQGKKKPVTNTTKGKWEVSGNMLTLQPGMKYKVEENKLRQLDMSGKEITGPLADMYVLTKK